MHSPKFQQQQATDVISSYEKYGLLGCNCQSLSLWMDGLFQSGSNFCSELFRWPNSWCCQTCDRDTINQPHSARRAMISYFRISSKVFGIQHWTRPRPKISETVEWKLEGDMFCWSPESANGFTLLAMNSLLLALGKPRTPWGSFKMFHPEEATSSSHPPSCVLVAYCQPQQASILPKTSWICWAFTALCQKTNLPWRQCVDFGLNCPQIDSADGSSIVLQLAVRRIEKVPCGCEG